MAKPVKDGILYFPFPVDFFHDPKIKRLERKYPGSGIRLYLKIRCDGHSRDGYYCPLDEDSVFSILDDLRIDEGEFNEIVDFMIEKKLLVEVTHSVLGRIVTSKDMQRDFQVAAAERIKKRQQRDKNYYFTVDSEIWILDEAETDKRICPGTFTRHSRDDNGSVYDCPDNRITEDRITEDNRKRGEDNNNERDNDVVRVSLSTEGIPINLSDIVDYIEKEYPWLDAEEVAEECEDSMVRNIENGDVPYIRSWKAFTRKVCSSKEF